MTTKITIEVNKKTKAGKAFLAMVDTILKNQSGIKIIEESTATEKTIANKKESKEQLIEELSKKVNKAVAEKWYKESGIVY
ncbi:MAG: hypothetical protein WCY89_04810 [Flavobacteriaceae bacterium]